MCQTDPCYSLSDRLPDPPSAGSGTDRHVQMEPAPIALIRSPARQAATAWAAAAPVAASPSAPSTTASLTGSTVVMPRAGSGVGGARS